MVTVSISISSSELSATLPLTGRGNTVAAVRAPSLSNCPSSALTARQHSCNPDSKLSANQALTALLPFLPNLPSAAQNQAASQAFGHHLTGNTWSLQGHVLVPWTAGSPHQSSQSSLTTKEEMQPAVTVLCQEALGQGQVFPEPSAHVCMGRGG